MFVPPCVYVSGIFHLNREAVPIRDDLSVKVPFLITLEPANGASARVWAGVGLKHCVAA